MTLSCNRVKINSSILLLLQILVTDELSRELFDNHIIIIGVVGSSSEIIGIIRSSSKIIGVVGSFSKIVRVVGSSSGIVGVVRSSSEIVGVTCHLLKSSELRGHLRKS